MEVMAALHCGGTHSKVLNLNVYFSFLGDVHFCMCLGAYDTMYDGHKGY